MQYYGLKILDDLYQYFSQRDSFLHPLGFRNLKRNNPQKLMSRLIRNYVISPIYLECKKIDRYPSHSKLMKEMQVKNFPLIPDKRIDHLLKDAEGLIKVLQNTSKTEQAFFNTPIQHSIKFLNGEFREKYFQAIQVETVTKISKREIDANFWEPSAELLKDRFL